VTDETARKVAGFLGLCTRAGQLSSGQEACVGAIRKGQATLALLDEGASENTRKRLGDACRTHGVPLYGMPPGRIGQAVGKEGRMAVCIGSGGMAQRLLELLVAETPMNEESPVSNQSEKERPDGGR
jgi:ribosomal protein L7Ae-like RNA K-turn-binding protein